MSARRPRGRASTPARSAVDDPSTSPRAVAFAYHDVGARCLRELVRQGFDVPLVVTHEDDPAEGGWFERVADVARGLGIEVATPADPGDPRLVERLRALQPDFVFSFYYRRMLPAAVLDCARRGALNMHGSLLPKYRGRAPVNWAVLNGERETGATLHYMTAKPDAGDIVGRRAVPIGPDDTAREVLDRVAAAAAALLAELLPALAAGRAPRLPNELAAGSYFGGRGPEDGRIDLAWPALRIHDLVRAVAPPYPGAFLDAGAGRVAVLRTARLSQCPAGTPEGPGLHAVDGALVLRAGDGACLAVADARFDGERLDAARWRAVTMRAPASSLPR